MNQTTWQATVSPSELTFEVVKMTFRVAELEEEGLVEILLEEDDQWIPEEERRVAVS
jgi:hypothetical protein